LDETMRFYTEVLGFEVAATMRDERAEWCALSYGVGQLMFTSEEQRRPTLSGRLYFYPEDVDALHARVVEHSAQSIHPPRAREYGMYEFSLDDPNGYLLSFGQPTDTL